MNPFICRREGRESRGMEHKGMGRRDLVCQQDRFPIVAVWRFFCRRENWGNRGNDAACCTNPHHTKSIEIECKDEDANYPLSRSLCVESNLITLPLQRKKFSVFYQRRKSIRPPALFPSTLPPSPFPFPFLSFFHSLVLRLSAVVVVVHPTHQIIVMAPMRRGRGTD